MKLDLNSNMVAILINEKILKDIRGENPLLSFKQHKLCPNSFDGIRVEVIGMKEVRIFLQPVVRKINVKIKFGRFNQ